MITIGVCEDQEADREMICHYIEQYGQVNHYEFKLISHSSGKEFWQTYASSDYKILFLDIYLDDTTGIDIAKELRAMGDQCALVFMTSSKDHAIEGFALRALHYLIKPISKDLVFQALTACTNVLKKEMTYLTIQDSKLKQRIYLKDIISIEVFDKVSLIHLQERVIKTYTPLSQLEKQLGGDPFLRCHRCSIVNMLFVKEFTTTDFIMANGESIGIRKIDSVDIRQYYLDFIFDQLRGESLGT